jgi:hypothetical protein
MWYNCRVKLLHGRREYVFAGLYEGVVTPHFLDVAVGTSIFYKGDLTPTPYKSTECSGYKFCPGVGVCLSHGVNATCALMEHALDVASDEFVSGYRCYGRQTGILFPVEFCYDDDATTTTSKHYTWKLAANPASFDKLSKYYCFDNMQAIFIDDSYCGQSGEKPPPEEIPYIDPFAINLPEGTMTEMSVISVRMISTTSSSVLVSVQPASMVHNGKWVDFNILRCDADPSSSDIFLSDCTIGQISDLTGGVMYTCVVPVVNPLDPVVLSAYSYQVPNSVSVVLFSMQGSLCKAVTGLTMPTRFCTTSTIKPASSSSSSSFLFFSVDMSLLETVGMWIGIAVACLCFCCALIQICRLNTYKEKDDDDGL